MSQDKKFSLQKRIFFHHKIIYFPKKYPKSMKTFKFFFNIDVLVLKN